MPHPDPQLRPHFQGALLGTMVGDALGMPVEGFTAALIEIEYGVVREMLTARLGRGTYTDDTEMMIGLAEALLDAPGRLDLDRVARRFADHFPADRGYGPNTQQVLASIRHGNPWRQAVDAFPLPGGSFGNGASMRVAPIALAFYCDPSNVAEAAEKQAMVTGHTHPAGRFGARLQAMAVLRAIQRGSRHLPFDGENFIGDCLDQAPPPFDRALAWIGRHLTAQPRDAAVQLGTDVRAGYSVPTALWAFLSCEKSAEKAIMRAVNLGGDADTIGAMTGAIAGAYHGVACLPARWLDALENGPRGREYTLGLADRLLELALPPSR